MIGSTMSPYEGEIPYRTNTQQNLNINMSNMFKHIGTNLGPEMNVIIGEINGTIEEINAQKALIDQAEAAALASKNMAATSEAVALAAANATPYTDDDTYSFPDTVVVESGEGFRCIGLLVKGDNPVGSTTGNWFASTPAPESRARQKFFTRN